MRWWKRLKKWFADPDYVWVVGPFGMVYRMKSPEACQRELEERIRNIVVELDK
jgi:hypothetical protein